MINFASTIAGLALHQFPEHVDERGVFCRFVEEVNVDIIQVSWSHNRLAGTLRGLHGLLEEAGERKFVTCISGSIFDVVVDLRPRSVTYLRQWSMTLNRPGVTVEIPPGCLHGYVSLEDQSTVLYAMTAEYRPELEFGRRWDDPQIGVDWPLIPRHISAKDASWPLEPRPA